MYAKPCSHRAAQPDACIANSWANAIKYKSGAVCQAQDHTFVLKSAAALLARRESLHLRMIRVGWTHFGIAHLVCPDGDSVDCATALYKGELQVRAQGIHMLHVRMAVHLCCRSQADMRCLCAAST